MRNGMRYKQNLHMHTTYCDGKHTPREMVEYAKKLGFESIGFSTHSYMSYSTYANLSQERQKQYYKEIQQLKREYKNEIEIYCGIEEDMYSKTETADYDYVIGAVHYLKLGNEYVGFDRSKEEVERIIHTYFGGNGLAYAKKYYECLAELPNYGRFDIIGHFDLITKHSENTMFFDEHSKEYLTYAIEAAEHLAGKIPLFEVNTGGIARGYRTTPYPSIPILKELKRLGYGAVISSDCHDGSKMDCGFDMAKELLEYCGFKYKNILTENGFVSVPL